MSKAARRATIGAVIRLLCDRFPQAFSRGGQDRRPLKIGIHADLMVALGDTVKPRDLKTALRAYTSNASYLRTLSAGAHRVGGDGTSAGTVTSEDEIVAKARLAELVKPPPRATVTKPVSAAQATPTASSISPGPPAQLSVPPAPKRLSLADLREAGRRRREVAA
jgi:sRNA-binding protein